MAGTGQVGAEEQQWRHISLALLLGFVFWNFWEALEIAFETPIGPTVGALQLLVIATVLSIVSFYLLRLDLPIGYGLTVLTGLAGIGGIALIMAGVFGSAKPGTPKLGVAVYLLVAALIIITGYLAWRDRSP